MTRALRISLASVLVLAITNGLAWGQRSGHSGSGALVAVHGRRGTIVVPAAVGGGYGWFMPYYGAIGPGGYSWYAGPSVFMGPPAMFPMAGPGGVPMAGGQGPLAPPPPAEMVEAVRERIPEPRPARKDPARAAQLVTVGDRLFRGNNPKKAEDRYLQAARLDAGSAAPQLRLAQVALVREQYVEAARHLRDAEKAEPGWILTAPDVQSLYGEPGEFANHVARLESYLQVHPDDRDGWLVLGAEWYLSGRAARASDVFLRLNDPKRKPDLALDAFLQATNQH